MMKRFNSVLVIGAMVAFLCGCTSEPDQQSRSGSGGGHQSMVIFCGGPTGGTFNFFANKIARIVAQGQNGFDLVAKGSGGSGENVRTLHKHGADMAIVYAGDAFLGRNGKLPGDPIYYDTVRSLSYLYNAPAQLVVRRESGIHSPQELVGRKVAIGNPGSGAAFSAERFFRHLQLWDDIIPVNLGYSKAAEEFIAGRIDAFWVLVGPPNASVMQAASSLHIALLNLDDAAVVSEFYDTYPFYTKTVIPAGTYEGQTHPVATFQDAALWCASSALSEQTVYDSLSAIYSAEGLGKLAGTHRAARDMGLANGLNGVAIPLHRGAYRFWRDKGIHVPSNIIPLPK